MEKSFDIILNHLEKYEENFKIIDKNKIFSYGTSGFRYDEKDLDQLLFRVAIVSCIKSITLGGLPIGIMITASHNKYTDNGIKIIAEEGGSISIDWEEIYSEIVNSKSLRKSLEVLVCNSKIGCDLNNIQPIINIGYDTRRSSLGLSTIAKDGCKLMNANLYDYEIITTPGLSFLTLLNQLTFKKNRNNYFFCSIDTYWNYLNGGYTCFNVLLDKFKFRVDNYEKEITFDCASGVAGYHADNILKVVNSQLSINAINTDYKTFPNLNNLCGAEYLHKDKKLPINYNKNTIKNLSVDGDVDRIVYFIPVENEKPIIIDGDRLTCLFSLTISFLINKLCKNLQKKFQEEISIGIVCTAYSNGGFMHYIENTLGFKVIIAKTGVKNLKIKADSYDIGIYFESNGHGTVHSQASVRGKIEKLNSHIESSNDSQILELLLIFLSMFNPTTGDSLSVFLATECALKLMNKSIKDLYYLYKELESTNMKVVVSDKNIFIPNHDETSLLEPIEVQDYINELNSSYGCRCFIRPSGTEDIVRIYSEAETAETAEKTALLVKTKIEDYFK